mgnify:CR=1 FL=1
MAKLKRSKHVVKRDVNIGVNKDGTPSKTYKKGDIILIPIGKEKNYLDNNII